TVRETVQRNRQRNCPKKPSKKLSRNCQETVKKLSRNCQETDNRSMKPADVCIALLVAIIWGLAFVASRIALDEFSPALMTTLRFAIAAVPCLFVRKPDVSWPLLVAISFTLFLGQFLAQAYGIAHGVPVGLSSVIVQSQALFTIAFAVIAFNERP